MAKDSSFHDYVIGEVFREIPGVTSRPMFGDWGVYRDGIFFAIIAGGRLYFKADETNQADYEQAGSEPFVYKGKDGKKMTMSYWELPAEVMEQPDELATWVEKSLQASKKSKKK